MGKGRERADALLVARGLAPSRTLAQALILAGKVSSEGRRVDKAGQLLPLEAELSVEAPPRFVSRGGDKLEGALSRFEGRGLEVKGRVCVDVGASTGGFSDCLLQRGAAKVYAVDVAAGMLAEKIRADPRVDVRERKNARELSSDDFDPAPSLAVVDASFISLALLASPLARVLAPGGDLVALVKPQFEAGREAASRGGGVIRDEAVRAAAIAKGRGALEASGFEILAEVDSPLRGPKGNLERFLWGRRRG